MAATGDTPLAHALGAELKAARVAADVGLRDLARRLDINHTMVSHWESGRRAPEPEVLATILGVLGVTGHERERLLEDARRASDPNWLAPGLERHLGALMEYERTAKLITSVQPLLIPGLLQTSDYAHAIMLAAGATRGRADQRVMMRMGRRDVLTRRTDPVQLRAVIGEYALRFPPCERAVMAEQLHELAKWQQLDNITIQVMPLEQGYSPMREGPFVLMEFERARSVMQIEHYRSTTTLTDARDVRDYKAAVEEIHRDAMSPEDSSGLIAKLTDEMESTT